MLLLLALLCASLYALRSSADEGSSIDNGKENFKRLFPLQLRDVLQSELLLTYLQEHVSQFAETTLGCSDYKSGAEIASIARSESEKSGYSIKVLSVYEEDNYMCFLLIDPKSVISDRITSLLSFRIEFPPPLKLHDSIYKVLEDKELDSYGERSNHSIEVNFPDKNVEKYLTIYYQDDYFLHTDISYDDDTFSLNEAPAYFQRLAASITQHTESKVYSEWFWTDDKTEHFVKSSMIEKPDLELNARGFKEDVNRINKIRTIANNTDVNIESLASLLPEAMTFSKGVLKIPLSFFHTVSSVDGVLDKNTFNRYILMVVALFSTHPSVTFIVIEEGEQLMNYRARSIEQSFYANPNAWASRYTQSGLTGGNQLCGVCDTGLDVNSCFFYDNSGGIQKSKYTAPVTDLSKRKVVQYSYGGGGDTNDDAGGHGTHVVGTVLGRKEYGNIYKNNPAWYSGVAPDAKVVFFDAGGQGIAPPGGDTIYKLAYDAGARVYTNSWGSYFNSASQYYSGQNLDEYLYEMKDFLILFAAGNAGTNGARTISTQGTAKNVIAVGCSQSGPLQNQRNSQNTRYIAYFSSMGPAYDNRIKPDIVGPGYTLNSAKASGSNAKTCTVTEKSGTSMASPAVAGAALLIRQYFMVKSFWMSYCNPAYKSCKQFSPTGSLLKAAILHGGSQMIKYDGSGVTNNIPLGKPPDSIQGFGRVALRLILPLNDKYQFDLFVDDESFLTENQELDYSIDIPSGLDDDLKVTLAWFDPPNVNGNTAKALINNLDLAALSPSGKKLHGNGGSSPDTINTNEQIHIEKPESGVWTIKVSAKALPVSGRQTFALIITSITGKVKE